MKVLIACEESQEVCKAFRELGFEAYSCDLKDCSGGHPEWHIKGDALKEVPVGLFTAPLLVFCCKSLLTWLIVRCLWDP